MADDGDLGCLVVILSVFLVVAGRSGGGNGQDSGDDELKYSIRYLITRFVEVFLSMQLAFLIKELLAVLQLTNFMLTSVGFGNN